MPPSPALTVLRRRLLAVSVVALLATIGVAAVSSAATIEVAVDGDVHDVRAFGGTVGDVLERLDIVVGPDDEISVDPRTPVDDDLSIDVLRAITVDIELNGAVARRVTAPMSTVAEVFEAAEMTDVLAEGARIEPARDAFVEDGDTIVVDLPTDVTIKVDGQTQHLATMAPTIEAVLHESGVELGPHDIVLPGDTGVLLWPTTVTVLRVEVMEDIEEVVLDHGEQRRESAELARGRTRVEREGREGLRRDIYRVTSVDGEEGDRELVREEVVTEPRDRIVLVGTKAPPASASSTDGVWERLAACESGGDWSAVSANGLYYGGLQFHPETWRSVGGTGMPHHASKAEQIKRGKILQQQLGWGQWPACSLRLGLR